jgi:hypothetical protein
LNAAVAILPTRRTVNAIWERYRVLCVQLNATPALMVDQKFREQIAEAEADWQRAFAQWVRGAA